MNQNYNQALATAVEANSIYTYDQIIDFLESSLTESELYRKDSSMYSEIRDAEHYFKAGLNFSEQLDNALESVTI